MATMFGGLAEAGYDLGYRSADYRAARDAAYSSLCWEGQRRYLEAVEGMTDKDVRRRVLMLARLLKRWSRGW